MNLASGVFECVPFINVPFGLCRQYRARIIANLEATTKKKPSKHVFLLIRATHYSQKPYGNVIFEPVYGGSGDSYAACFEMWAQGMYLLHASVSSLADVFLLLCVHNFTTHPRCQCSVDFRMQLFLQGDQAPAGTG